MVNINSGGWNQVTNFAQGGYTGTIQTTYDWGYAGDFNGLDVWTGDSGGYISTIATLGTLDVGDSVEIMFRGGWDWFSKGGNPNWAVDNISLSVIPEPKTYALILGAVCCAFVYFRKRRRI